LQEHLPSDFKVAKMISNDSVTVKIEVRKSILNQKVPWAIQLSAMAVSELERSNVDQAN